MSKIEPYTEIIKEDAHLRVGISRDGKRVCGDSVELYLDSMVNIVRDDGGAILPLEALPNLIEALSALQYRRLPGAEEDV